MFGTSKLLNINDATKRIGNFFKLPIQLFHGVPYPELALFDLFAITTFNDKQFCFGCVQCKTSIRDRVTRDREPSIHAMNSYFWSVVFVLDGEYLRNPKFQYMVNGGSKEFPTNGWHGMYDVSASFNIGRIYPLDLDFHLLRKHSEKAVSDWLQQRQWFNHEWKAD